VLIFDIRAVVDAISDLPRHERLQREAAAGATAAMRRYRHVLVASLESLLLPYRFDGGFVDDSYDAFLCRLSSLSTPPALQHLSALSCV
jgi:hypothetical protein